MTMAQLPPLVDMAVWGLAATVTMTGLLHGAAAFGMSRLSIPFLVGTIFTGNRHKATIAGFTFYIVGGWLFALLYFLFFASIGVFTWWLGALLGFLHGLFLLVVAMPLIPYAHPRMASTYDMPVARPQLEPPGLFGLNYGPGTPAAVLVAQTVYGAILGALPQIGLSGP